MLFGLRDKRSLMWVEHETDGSALNSLVEGILRERAELQDIQSKVSCFLQPDKKQIICLHAIIRANKSSEIFETSHNLIAV